MQVRIEVAHLVDREREDVERVPVALRVPERPSELERRLAPLDPILEQLDRLAQVLRGRGSVDSALREAELEQDARPLLHRGRLVEGPPEVRDGRVGGASRQRSRSGVAEPLDHERVAFWLGEHQVARDLLGHGSALGEEVGSAPMKP